MSGDEEFALNDTAAGVMPGMENMEQSSEVFELKLGEHATPSDSLEAGEQSGQGRVVSDEAIEVANATLDKFVEEQLGDQGYTGHCAVLSTRFIAWLNGVPLESLEPARMAENFTRAGLIGGGGDFDGGMGDDAIVKGYEMLGIDARHEDSFDRAMPGFSGSVVEDNVYTDFDNVQNLLEVNHGVTLFVSGETLWGQEGGYWANHAITLVATNADQCLIYDSGDPNAEGGTLRWIDTEQLLRSWDVPTAVDEETSILKKRGYVHTTLPLKMDVMEATIASSLDGVMDAQIDYNTGQVNLTATYGERASVSLEEINSLISTDPQNVSEAVERMFIDNAIQSA